MKSSVKINHHSWLNDATTDWQFVVAGVLVLVLFFALVYVFLFVPQLHK